MEHTLKMKANNQQSVKSESLSVFILLFVISLGLSAFLFLKYAKNVKKVRKQNEELLLAYSVLKLDKDSMQLRLNIIQLQLEDRINENLAQADLKAELRNQLEAKKRALLLAHRHISKLLNSKEILVSADKQRSLLEARKEIDNLMQSNVTHIAEIEKAQKEYKATQVIAQQRALKISELGKQKDSLIITNKVLKNRLSKARNIQITDLNLEPIRRRKGKQEVTDKASKVELLKINFKVLGSDFIIEGTKEIIIRIIAPNGTVLTQDTRKLTDTSELYTLKNTMQYDGTEKGITYYYQHTAEYAQGRYHVELYHNDQLLDRKRFSLR